MFGTIIAFKLTRLTTFILTMFLKLVIIPKHHLKPVKPSILLILIPCLLKTNLFLMTERLQSLLENGLFLTANSEIGHKLDIGIKTVF